jgi:hypothetical protein
MWGVGGGERCGASVEVRDVGPCRAVPGLTRCNGSGSAARRRRAKGPLKSVWERVAGGTHRAGVSAGACSGCLFLDGGASEAWKDCSGGKQRRQAAEASSGGKQRRQAAEASSGGKQRRQAAEAAAGSRVRGAWCVVRGAVQQDAAAGSRMAHDARCRNERG